MTTFAGRTWAFEVRAGPAIEVPLGRIAGLAVDPAGNIYAADYDNHVVVRIFPDGLLEIWAGNGSPGFSGDGGPATSASLNAPRGLAVDAQGNLYIADLANHRVRRVTPDGAISTYAGGGSGPPGGDGGPATAASLAGPRDLAIDSAGNLFMLDYGLRKVAPDGTITPIARPPPLCLECTIPPSLYISGAIAIAVDRSDNVWITSFDGPVLKIMPDGSWSTFPVAGVRLLGGIAVDFAGKVYLADTYNQRVRVMEADGSLRTIAGSGQGFAGDGGPGLSAYFNQPTVLVLDSSGNLYVADSLNYRVRRIRAGGTIETIAGSGLFRATGDSGPAVEAVLNSPHGVHVDAAGNVYIADSGNHRVRMVTPDGVISTVAGTGSAAYGGDGGWAVGAWLREPYGVATDAGGSLYIADRLNHRVRRVDPLGRITTVAGNGNGGFRGDGGPATSADLGYPTLVAFDPAALLYIATQSEIVPVRKVALSGEINWVFGPPPANFILENILSEPPTYGIALDRQGNLYFSQRWRHQVSRLSPDGQVTLIAGSGKPGFSGDGGPALQADLRLPQAVVVDGDGNVNIVDRGNRRIRCVDAAGIITTVAGSGEAGLPVDGMRATDAPLGDPYAITVGDRGELYIADLANDRIFKVAEGVRPPREFTQPSLASGQGVGRAGPLVAPKP